MVLLSSTVELIAVVTDNDLLDATAVCDGGVKPRPERTCRLMQRAERRVVDLMLVVFVLRFSAVCILQFEFDAV